MGLVPGTGTKAPGSDCRWDPRSSLPPQICTSRFSYADTMHDDPDIDSLCIGNVIGARSIGIGPCGCLLIWHARYQNRLCTASANPSGHLAAAITNSFAWCLVYGMPQNEAVTKMAPR